MDSLLAKSPHGNRSPKTLREHTRDVLDAAQALFGTPENPTRLCRCWLRLFRLDQDASEPFLSALAATCALHDLGKANEDFQEVVRGGRDGQLLRHEHVSGLLMVSDGIRRWLEQRTDVDWDIVLSAVVCHHLKADSDSVGKTQTPRQSLRMTTEHPDLANLLGEISE